MGDLNILAPDLAHELHIVIARHAHRSSSGDRFHNQSHNPWTLWAAIHQIAEKYELSSIRVSPSATGLLGIAKRFKQHDQFVVTAMNVANDVEGTVLLLLVVPQRLSFKGRSIHLFRRVEHKHVAKSLTLQSPQRAPELLALLPNHVRAKVAVIATFVAVLAQPFRKVQNDGHGQTVILPRQ